MDSADSSRNLDPRWLAQLRERFAEIAARRVPESAAEDVVHDALAVVLAKGLAEADRHGQPDPPLSWSFTVLRNVIGNYYQNRRGHESVDGMELTDDRPDVLAALTTAERARTIRSAVDDLRRENAECADWLWSLAQGGKVADLARRAQLDPSVLYRRLYRCRRKLAEILRGKGVTA